MFGRLSTAAAPERITVQASGATHQHHPAVGSGGNGAAASSDAARICRDGFGQPSTRSHAHNDHRSCGDDSGRRVWRVTARREAA